MGTITHLVIALQERPSECIACGEPLVDPRQGLPMREGRILEAGDGGEWGGFDCCVRCFMAWAKGGPAAVYARLERVGEARR